jgi:hypothetical protein
MQIKTASICWDNPHVEVFSFANSRERRRDSTVFSVAAHKDRAVTRSTPLAGTTSTTIWNSTLQLAAQVALCSGMRRGY